MYNPHKSNTARLIQVMILPSPDASSFTLKKNSPGSFIDGRPKTAAEKRREKRLLDDPLADLLGPLFVGCKRCGTRIKLSPKSSYDPFHWVKHRERCLRRSIETVKEILREKEDRTGTFGAGSSPQQDGGAAIVDTQFSASSRLLSPSPSSAPSLSSPSFQRRTDTDSITTPPLLVDEDEVGVVSHSSLSDQHELPPGQDETVTSECGGSLCDGGEAPPPPLCALSVFRAPEMLAFEDYLHRSRRLPTRIGFPDLLSSPDRWHDWSWGRLRAPVYVVPKRPEETEVIAGPSPPHPSHRDAGNGTLHSEGHNLSDPSSNTP